ncbi:CDP-alcohol phosphatidyltransferase family protein [Aestuariibius insulae]|uniref:CDP-alcohol phosphatidyltransferase family protein n=1 Tax=Aestuariibius insulae TaxID=2058287 RepID=UPI00345E5D71
MTDPARRPIKTRDAGWVRRIARRLSASDVTPNQISKASMGFAALAGGAFAAAGWLGAGWPLLVAAVGIQMRLLCNLFDGLVAVEGGKAEPDGPLWNEMPDRVADLLILVGAGVAAGAFWLGWAAAAGALLTAYIRAMGVALGAPEDFGGPMAKPQRMAVMTSAAVLGFGEWLWTGSGYVLLAGLAVVAAGSGATFWLRTARLLRHLRDTG